MAKFLIVTSSARTESESKKFQKNYSVIKVRKGFKCKSVHELKLFDSDFDLISEMTEISDSTLKSLLREMNLGGSGVFCREFGFALKNSKVFALSDDASDDFIKESAEKVSFKIFELDQEGLESFVYWLSELDDSDTRIDQLNSAKELWESLRDLEFELSLDLVSMNADDSIESELIEIEEEQESLKSQIDEVFVTGWN
jgi:hypothetical protein